MTFFQTAETN
jgi:hypothetical protein